MPASAPLPTPTMSAAGVAMPSAQGQAMISTAMNARSPCGKSPAIHQPDEGEHRDADDRGHEVRRSPGRRAAGSGAVLACASSTSLMICASAVSAPTRVALNRSMPGPVERAADHLAPGRFSTGIDSPVSIDSSTDRRAVDHLAVGRDLLAGPHDDDLADHDRLGRDLHLRAVADDAGRRRAAGPSACGPPPTSAS